MSFLKNLKTHEDIPTVLLKKICIITRNTTMREEEE